jgi:hypothetical protein
MRNKAFTSIIRAVIFSVAFLLVPSCQKGELSEVELNEQNIFEDNRFSDAVNTFDNEIY